MIEWAQRVMVQLQRIQEDVVAYVNIRDLIGNITKRVEVGLKARSACPN
jgi:hypothetical protein